MYIKDFDKILFSETVIPDNSEGSFKEATEVTVKTGITYLFNPVTDLAVKMSEFFYSYWPEYNETGAIEWLYLENIPSQVIQHSQNHFRATAISILKKQGLTAHNLIKLSNIALGAPFTLVSGIVEIDYSDGYAWVYQYPFQTTIAGSTSYCYRFPESQVLNFQSNDIVDFYEPICSGLVEYYDIFNHSSDVFDAIDIDGSIPLQSNSTQTIDYNVNINRSILIQKNRDISYPYSFTYFTNLMKKIFPKDMILFFKENIP